LPSIDCITCGELGWDSNYKYRCDPVSTDSVSAVYHCLNKNLKIKEINGSYISKLAPSENRP
jgi:hypothetical protein